MRRPALIAFILLTVSLTAAAQVATGDEHWNRRAEGHQGPRAAAGQIDAAINAYQQAVNASPGDLEARWKLLRAMRFKAAYVPTSQEQRKQFYADARKAGEQAVAVVERVLAAKGVRNPQKAGEKDIAAVARTIPGAGEVYFWSAVNWGEWALAYGKLAAARQGVADTVRREATIAMLIDPLMESAGGARVLGRLHDQTPRVPFLTMWASSEKAVAFLTDALKRAPEMMLTRVFLAEAMVGNDRGTKPQAIRMLQEVVAGKPDPEWLVEELDAQRMAAELLHNWGVR